jgi:F0F1-type ATP synthase delta subunit
MNSARIAVRYAKALFDLALEGNVLRASTGT